MLTQLIQGLRKRREGEARPRRHDFEADFRPIVTGTRLTLAVDDRGVISSEASETVTGRLVSADRGVAVLDEGDFRITTVNT